MSNHIRDLLLITQLLIAELYFTVATLRFSAAAKLLFLTSTEWWPNRACFLSVTPPSPLAKCSHKQDRPNNDDRASQRQPGISLQSRLLWDCKIQNSHSKMYKSVYLSSVVLQRHVPCRNFYAAHDMQFSLMYCSVRLDCKTPTLQLPTTVDSMSSTLSNLTQITTVGTYVAKLLHRGITFSLT